MAGGCFSFSVVGFFSPHGGFLSEAYAGWVSGAAVAAGEATTRWIRAEVVAHLVVVALNPPRCFAVTCCCACKIDRVLFIYLEISKHDALVLISSNSRYDDTMSKAKVIMAATKCFFIGMVMTWVS
jgi:hypothetical protein